MVLISGAIVFKEDRGKLTWFVVKQTDDGDWEIPKVVVRKVESSVRASLRMVGEQGGMDVKVLEEAGRSGGVVTVNNKVLPQRQIYYLLHCTSGDGDVVGFSEYEWLEYASAIRKLTSKRERLMLKQARDEYKKWKKTVVEE